MLLVKLFKKIILVMLFFYYFNNLCLEIKNMKKVLFLEN